MRNKNRKIGKKKSPKAGSLEKSSAFRAFRVTGPGFEPLTIFAESPGQAQSVARRLRGLRRLVADLDRLTAERPEIEAGGFESAVDGLGAEIEAAGGGRDIPVFFEDNSREVLVHLWGQIINGPKGDG